MAGSFFHISNRLTESARRLFDVAGLLGILLVSAGADEKGEHWAFQPVKTDVAPPSLSAAGEAWARSDIDRFVMQPLDAEKLLPLDDAEPVVLVRRLYFTLTGLPPSAEEMEEFIKNPDAEALVDHLLDSSRFGEKWARHWLDLARYAESNGKDRNVAFAHAWRYRDWVIDAMNADLPYNEFVADQIAGDLRGGSDAQIVATGFLTLGPKAFQEAQQEKFAMDVADEQIDVMSRSILALTVACARCHDHKFDPIPTADYYALAGIFLSSETLHGPGPLYFKYHHYDQPVVAIGDKAEALDPKVQAWRGEIYELTMKAIDLRSAAYKIKRKVTGTLRDRGLKKPEEDPELLKMHEQSEAMYASAAEAMEKREKLLTEVPQRPAYAMALIESAAPEDCRIRERGEYNKHGDKVVRGKMTIPGLPELGEIADTESGRRQLADWLTSAENPLTARVLVNRVWHHLFGRGLVATVDNFGTTGESPSHPELLDWLAQKFVTEDEWSVKKLIRRIVLTRTWQLASTVAEENDPRLAAAIESDPGNRLLWRANLRRLEVESFRDAVMTISGQLDLERPADGSPLAKVFLGSEIGTSSNRIDISGEIAAFRHRTVYLPILRNELPEILQLFDFADVNAVSGSRNVRTIPSQALFLMNSDFVEEQAKAAAGKMAGLDDDAAVELMARLVRGVPFETMERSAILSFVEQQRGELRKQGRADVEASLEMWTDVFQSVFASAEFRYLR